MTKAEALWEKGVRAEWEEDAIIYRLVLDEDGEWFCNAEAPSGQSGSKERTDHEAYALLLEAAERGLTDAGAEIVIGPDGATHIVLFPASGRCGGLIDVCGTSKHLAILAALDAVEEERDDKA